VFLEFDTVLRVFLEQAKRVVVTDADDALQMERHMASLKKQELAEQMERQYMMSTTVEPQIKDAYRG
jgi:dephospho-CoA kinase